MCGSDTYIFTSSTCTCTVRDSYSTLSRRGVSFFPATEQVPFMSAVMLVLLVMLRMRSLSIVEVLQKPEFELECGGREKEREKGGLNEGERERGKDTAQKRWGGERERKGETA